MGKLPKRIIKKYGISKKAWAVYRAETKKTPATRKKTTRGKMAKRKTYKRRTSKKQSSGFKLLSGTTSMLAAVGYGFVRDRMSDALAKTDLVKKLPVTNFTDEGVMLGVNFVAKKMGLGKMPIVGSLLRAQKTIELARIGETISDNRQVKVSGNAQGIFIN